MGRKKRSDEETKLRRTYYKLRWKWRRQGKPEPTFEEWMVDREKRMQQSTHPLAARERFRAYNNTRKARGLDPVTMEEYEQMRAQGFQHQRRSRSINYFGVTISIDQFEAMTRRERFEMVIDAAMRAPYAYGVLL